MGASLNTGGSSGGGGRRRRRKRHQPMSEINVTPFVDVMLVLLVIFMVAAPLLSTGVPLELPESKAKELATPQTEPLTVSLDAKGEIFIQDTKVTREKMTSTLRAITKGNVQQTIFVRADRSLDYGRVVSVMGELSGAGFTRLSLVTNQAS